MPLPLMGVVSGLLKPFWQHSSKLLYSLAVVVGQVWCDNYGAARVRAPNICFDLLQQRCSSARAQSGVSGSARAIARWHFNAPK
jgi:hypothetical protein